MDDVLKRIMYFEKINEIYSNKLFTIKSIAQHLDLWDSLSVDEKNQLDGFINSTITRHDFN